MTNITHDRVTREAGFPASIVNAVDAVIATVATAVAVLSLVALFLALGAEVVVRYLTTQGLGWPGEMPNLLFPWLVMGGIVMAAQTGQHIAVTAILSFLGRASARILLLALQVLIAATFFYLSYIGLAVIEITGTEIYPMTGVSARYAYLALIFGFVGVGLTAVTSFVRLLIAEDPLSVRASAGEAEI